MNVSVIVDGSDTPLVELVANVNRPDLVKAGVAPNPEHGFEVCFSPEQWSPLQRGLHRLQFEAVGSPQTTPIGWDLPQSPICVYNGKPTAC